MSLPSGGGTTFPSNSDLPLVGPARVGGAASIVDYEGVQIAPDTSTAPDIADVLAVGGDANDEALTNVGTFDAQAASATGDSTGGRIALAPASGANGGAATIAGGHRNTHSDRPGGQVVAESGTDFHGGAKMVDGGGGRIIRVGGNDGSGILLQETDGILFIPNLPVADPHVVGRIWADSGVLTVSAG